MSTDQTNPGISQKAPIERLLEMMDKALSEQNRAAELRSAAQTEQINQLANQIRQLHARFDSVNGKIGLDERLRQIEAEQKLVAKKEDLLPITKAIEDLNQRVQELEEFEEERKRDRAELTKEVRSSVVKWAVPVLLGALVVGLFILALVQFQALRGQLP